MLKKVQAKKSKSVKKRPKRSFFLILGLILVIGSFTITIFSKWIQIREKKQILNQKKEAYEMQVAKNDRLQSIVDSDDKSDYIEQVAREKLGFVLPGEKVFYDVTPGE